MDSIKKGCSPAEIRQGMFPNINRNIYFDFQPLSYRIWYRLSINRGPVIIVSPLRFVFQGIMLGAQKAVEHLKEISKQVTNPEEIRQIAIISANGDEHVGNLISTAMEKVGEICSP